MTTLQTLQPIADSQHGLITARQAATLGVSDKVWRRLIAKGMLLDEGNRVARLLGAPSTPEQRVMRGILGTGTHAVASHASGAFLWGGLLSIPDGPVDVLTRRDIRSYQSRDDCRVHRPVDWMDVGTAKRANIPVTHPVRTLIDLGATCPGLVKFAVERMVIAGLVTPDGLERALRRHSRQGRAGVVALRNALEDWSFGEGIPDSVLEVRFSDLIARRGLPPPVYHYVTQGFILDAAWPDRMVGAEVDGLSKYVDKTQFQNQIERDALLQAAGWRMFHFTWRDVTQRDRYVAAVLRRALRGFG